MSFKVKIDFPKCAGESKYMEELKVIENETGTSMKILIHIKGNPNQIKTAEKRISEIKCSDKLNSLDLVEIQKILDAQNKSNQALKEEFFNSIQELKDDLNIMKKEILENQREKAQMAEKMIKLQNEVKAINGVKSDMKNMKTKIDKNEDSSEDEDVDLNLFFKSEEYLSLNGCPLTIASILGRLDVIKKLIRHGGDVNTKDMCNNTLLFLSSVHGHLNIVKYLIKKNASINEISILGSTALHMAVINGHADIVEFLCSKKADIFIRDTEDLSAMDYARLHKKTEILKILEKYYKQIPCPPRTQRSQNWKNQRRKK